MGQCKGSSAQLGESLCGRGDALWAAGWVWWEFDRGRAYGVGGACCLGVMGKGRGVGKGRGKGWWWVLSEVIQGTGGGGGGGRIAVAIAVCEGGRLSQG